jgi:hypothetical protein
VAPHTIKLDSLANHVLPVIVRSSLHNVSNALEEIDKVVWVPSVEVFIMALRYVLEVCVEVTTKEFFNVISSDERIVVLERPREDLVLKEVPSAGARQLKYSAAGFLRWLTLSNLNKRPCRQNESWQKQTEPRTTEGKIS